VTTNPPIGMHSDVCPGAGQCTCTPLRAPVDLVAAQLARDLAIVTLCELCETPITETVGAGWRHTLGLVERGYCQLPTPPEDPLILGDVPPLDALPTITRRDPPGCTSCGGH
jgi:hypothetical protein